MQGKKYKIKIKPENKGKFTKKANEAGEGVQEFANDVLANKDNYSTSTVKQANFAHNANSWKKYSKGTKKIKKYDEGVQKVDLSQFGGQFGGIAGGLGAMGIEAATKSKYDPKYTSQLKDENQAIGRGIGAAAGQGLNLIAPGLGSIASPLLSSAGGAIQRSLQEDKLKELKDTAEYKDRVAKANENIQTDLTSFQAKQYSKGGKVKSKVIEIEGKETPEIHTDKNFNLKNLGTTPHSKGGDKVLAEEGDVVFPTQNSPKKYNEIIDAVMKKDKYKLKKEQAKLPEDKSPKYKKGVKSVDPLKMSTSEYKDYLKKTTKTPDVTSIDLGMKSKNPLVNSRIPKEVQGLIKDNTAKGASTTSNRVVGKAASTPSNLTASSKIQPELDANGKPMYFDKVNMNQQYNGNRDWNTAGAKDLTAHDPSNPYAKNGLPVRAIPLANGQTRYYQNPTGVQPMETRMTGMGSTTPTIPSKVEPIPVPTKEDKDVVKEDDKTGGFNNKYNPLELASTAYNLGQGLFGNTEKVNRREFNPELERYVDTSNNMRREVNSGYKTNLANARNLSAGSANNFRGNAQAASNAKLQQMNSIDSQEYGKQVDVNNRNVGRLNDAKQINFNAQNVYDDLDAQNRAVKSDALSRGFEGLSDIGTRSNMNRNALQAKLIEADAIKSGYSYGKTPTTQGTQITGLNTDFTSGGGIPAYVSPEAKKKANPKSKLGVKIGTHEKGSKSISVVRKYKLK